MIGSQPTFYQSGPAMLYLLLYEAGNAGIKSIACIVKWLPKENTTSDEVTNLL